MFPKSSLLVRITIFMDGAAGFFGIAFIYSDGSKEMCGSDATTHELGQTIPCVEQSFLIDGPGGERITGLAYSTGLSPHTGDEGIASLEITTQFNRHYLFRGYDRKGFESLQRTVVDIPTHHYLTALVIESTAPLCCLSALYAASSSPIPAMIPNMKSRRSIDITQYNTDYAAWMTRRAGSTFTSASFSGVRRIRVSAGRPGRSCGTQHLCGLWLEYSNKADDTVVGQWLQDAGSFTLEPGETLVTLSIHGTQSVKAPENSAHAEIQLPWKGIYVVGLSFQTSLGKRHEFHRSKDQLERTGVIKLVYAATPYEELDTITWASNVKADDIQVSFKPSPLLGTDHLLLCEASYSIRDPSLSLQQTREFITYDGAGPELMNPVDKSGVYGAMRRYYQNSEIFLWHERSPINGALARLIKMEVIYDVESNGVRGFRCTYEGDFKKEFGLMSGAIYTLDLSENPDEKISLFVARCINDANYGIEFHTTTGQICRAIPDGIDDYEVDSYAMVPGVKPPKIMGETQWRKTHWSFPESNLKGQAVSHSVGFWVSGKRVRKLHPGQFLVEVPFIDAFGPIYVTGPSVKSSRPNLSLSLKEKIHNATHKDNWNFR